MKLNRRDCLVQSTWTTGALAVTASALPASSAWANDSGVQTLVQHHPAKAKRVIFLFMHGGPSHVDTFDYKPMLIRDNGKDLPFELPPQISAKPTLLASPWKWSQHGEAGLWATDLLPEMNKHLDSLCVVRSMHTRGQSHGQAVGMVNTGSDNFVRPSVGAWISYALGAGHPDLPAHVAIAPATAHGGPRNYGAAFLPAKHQATVVGRNGQIGDGKIAYLDAAEEHQFDLVNQINRGHAQSAGRDRATDGAIEAVDLANRMRGTAPEVMDLSTETEATKKLYGIGEKTTDSFGRSCLMARRLAESGVRFITVSSGQVWDQHGNLKNGHEKNAAKTDLPIAGLFADLKQRGLWEDTLVVWGGEFGRTPVVQGSNGRDHNPQGFSMVLGGGGIRGGITYGETDDYGYYAVRDRVHMHDLHATMLHQLGIDHERLTYPYAGRDFRLTDVHGRVVSEIIES
ncbi:DUF1501 domain-containing protein [Rhodopirellula baltica]|nr:DUF1501 domain-containing protein [Rhodopirellula baltica]